MRLRVCVEGDLSRALAWEARRRGIDAEDLALSLIQRASARICKSWEKAHEGVSFIEPTASGAREHTCESVLEKAYGPDRPATRRTGTAEP